MAENEIVLLKEQLNKLDEKKFDLEAWKNHTLIFLERIFGVNSTKVQMIKDLRYDYSSWNLRDVSGAGKSKDPVRMQAAEILEAVIFELEQLGLPNEARTNEKLLTLLEDELTGKQLKEIEKLLNSKSPNKAEKVQEILDKLKKEDLSLIISRLLTS
ncbi:MAG: hypothetical protein HQ541_10400 [Mariniphaga sp.]|nr:hypothetical protein [Mariniphaga sp.]